MTMTSNRARLAPTDRELLTGERTLSARTFMAQRPRNQNVVEHELDRALAQSMDASDPLSITQP
jgi:hypothetical protein